MNKKYILPLLLLVSALGLSAQENSLQPSFSVSSLRGTYELSGDINSGLWTHFNNKTDGDPFLQVAGSDGVPVRINLRGQYDSAEKDLGFSFVLRGQARNIASADEKPRMDPNRNNNLTDILFFESAFGYVKLFNGILTFTGGYWNPEIWETPGGLSSDLGMEGAGLIIDVSPMPGLNIMASGWAKEGDWTLLKEAKYIFTGIYTMADQFKVVAHFAARQYGVLGFAKDDDVTNRYGKDGYTSYNELAEKDQRFGMGIAYLGLQSAGFTRLGIDTRIYNLGGAKSPGWDGTKMIKITPFFLGQRITWAWEGLELDGRFYQRFNLGDDRWNYGPSFRFRMTARYALPNKVAGIGIAPKLGFNLIMNSNPWGDNPVDMRFDEGIINWEECDTEKSGWGICPAVEFRVGSLYNAFLELGYSLKVNTGKPDDLVPVTEKSSVNHAVYLFLKISMGRLY